VECDYFQLHPPTLVELLDMVEVQKKVTELEEPMSKIIKGLVLIAAVALMLVTVLDAVPVHAQTSEDLQSQINNTPSGGTLNLSGTYNTSVGINKPITITGTATINSPSTNQDIIQVTSNGVTINGLTLNGGAAGVNVEGVSCVISNVHTSGDLRSVYLNNAHDCQITNCQFANGGYGVYGDSASRDTISNNTILANTGMEGITGSGALGDGIFFNLGNSNTVSHNNLSDNMAFGVSQYSCPNNVIDFNTISANTRIGVRVGPGSDNCQLHDNAISNNGLAPASSALAQSFPACGVIIVSAQNVHIWNNTFTGNPANVVGIYTTSPVQQPAPPSTQPVSTQPVSTQPVSTQPLSTQATGNQGLGVSLPGFASVDVPLVAGVLSVFALLAIVGVYFILVKK